jgi:hypothetical protein
MAFAAPSVLKGKDFWTPQRRLWAAQDTGRRPGRLPGGHVGDCEDLKKAIILCEDGCVKKFNAKRAEYVVKKNIPIVRGKCDGCSQFTSRGRLLVHYTLANIC